MIVRIGNHPPLSLAVPCQLSKGQVETPEANFASGMRQLNGVYTQLYNRRHRTVGHLLQGRHKAVLIQKDSHLLEVCRYVVLNPLRAKAVARVESWKWSSYKGTAGLGEGPSG